MADLTGDCDFCGTSGELVLVLRGEMAACEGGCEGGRDCPSEEGEEDYREALARGREWREAGIASEEAHRYLW